MGWLVMNLLRARNAARRSSVMMLTARFPKKWDRYRIRAAAQGTIDAPDTWKRDGDIIKRRRLIEISEILLSAYKDVIPQTSWLFAANDYDAGENWDCIDAIASALARSDLEVPPAHLALIKEVRSMAPDVGDLADRRINAHITALEAKVPALVAA